MSGESDNRLAVWNRAQCTARAGNIVAVGSGANDNPPARWCTDLGVPFDVGRENNHDGPGLRLRELVCVAEVIRR